MSELVDPISNLIDDYHKYNQSLSYYDRPANSLLCSNSNAATPLVLIHGWLDSWKSWSLILENLQTPRRIIAISLRGFGDSTKEGVHTVAAHASDIIDLLSQLQLTSCIIAGHSMGALVCTSIATKHSNLIQGLILCSAALKIKSHHIYDSATGASITDLHQTVNTLFSNSTSHAENEDARLFLESFHRREIHNPIEQGVRDDFMAMILQESLKSCPLACRDSLSSIIEEDHSKQFKNIKVPVLIIWGQNDTFFDINEQNNIKEALNNAISISFNAIESAGHSMIWTHAREVAELMDDWLDCE
jgi:pimeloyl-ACP methyl ester carboxylesterase